MSNINVSANLGLDFGAPTQNYQQATNSLLSNMSSLGFGTDSTSQSSSSNNSQLSMLSSEIQALMEILQMLEQQVQQMEQGQGQGSQGSGDPTGGTGSGDPTGGTGSGDPTGGAGGCGGGHHHHHHHGGITTPMAPARQDNWFDNASGGSTGDPHLSFSGANSGSDPNSKWDDMGSQKDLVDANKSFFGGYQVSTKTTDPNANGITYNKSATVTTGNGRDTVTMGKDGKISVNDDGHKIDLQKGQTVTLLSGAKVTENDNGSVTVTDNNHKGGQMSTTMNWNGSGVDVNFNSSNVFLGGDLPHTASQHSVVA